MRKQDSGGSMGQSLVAPRRFAADGVMIVRALRAGYLRGYSLGS